MPSMPVIVGVSVTQRSSWNGPRATPSVQHGCHSQVKAPAATSYVSDATFGSSRTSPPTPSGSPSIESETVPPVPSFGS